MKYKTAGIVVPMKIEAEEFFQAFMLQVEKKGPREFFVGNINGRKVVLVLSWCGPVNAAAATEALINYYSPDVVFNSGCAGAHNIELMPGDVVIGDKYTINFDVRSMELKKEHAKMQTLIRFMKDGEKVKLDFLEADPNLLSLAKKVAGRSDNTLTPFIPEEDWPKDLVFRQPKIFIGTIGSEENWTTDSGEINLKRGYFGHETEDKETSYIAQICAFHGTPFLGVRGVSDNELIYEHKDKEDLKEKLKLAGVSAAKLVRLIILGLR